MVPLTSVGAVRDMLRKFREEITRSELELTSSRNKKSTKSDILRKRIAVAKVEERQLSEKIAKFFGIDQ